MLFLPQLHEAVTENHHCFSTREALFFTDAVPVLRQVCLHVCWKMSCDVVPDIFCLASVFTVPCLLFVFSFFTGLFSYVLFLVLVQTFRCGRSSLQGSWPMCDYLNVAYHIKPYWTISYIRQSCCIMLIAF